MQMREKRPGAVWLLREETASEGLSRVPIWKKTARPVGLLQREASRGDGPVVPMREKTLVKLLQKKTAARDGLLLPMWKKSEQTVGLLQKKAARGDVPAEPIRKKTARAVGLLLKRD